MKCVVQFVVLAAILGSAIASVDPVYNVTSGVEDYTLLVGRSMQITLDLAALKLATAKLRHADRMESIVNQQQLVMQEMQQFDSSLVQHQALSLSRKHCVQKYKPIVPTVKEANKNFTLCLSYAESSAIWINQNAENDLSKATQVREIAVPGILPQCRGQYSQESKIADCVTEKVDAQLELFNSDMDRFEISLQQSLYSSSTIAAEATRCSFAVEKRVLASNGAVLGLSEVCDEGFKAQGPSAVAMSERNVLEQKLLDRLRVGRDSSN